eukprot:TRINITY_DN1608_c0_g4_i14.p1 TRINITY_DN1608_c0_g4~~TRINITY_DN1608_c0_g4_i14.p1  ORF type:complete len:627 (+),score=158.61 TRINITY_DN1608_c0_g4_i14:177-2057(+)
MCIRDRSTGNAVAAMSSPTMAERLKANFDALDVDGDGILDLGELSKVMEKCDPDNPHRNRDLWHMMDALDTKPPYGRIQWEEFKNYYLHHSGSQGELSYGPDFTNPEWAEALKAASNNSSAGDLVPDNTIRHHHYEGSTMLNAAEVPSEYKVGALLGQGHYASVHLVERENHDPKVLAMKIFYKDEMKSKQVHAVIREANLMRAVGGHPNIVEIHDLIETRQRLLLMLEPVMGGHLYSVIIARAKKKVIITEQTVARVMRQMFSALAHMHKNHVIHCDLKPENIMCTSGVDNADFNIKITDFGLSKHLLDDNHNLKSFAGTPLYAAPEVHGPSRATLERMRKAGQERKNYGPAADVWSAGCMMFELLVGKAPFFRSQNMPELKRRLHMFEGVLSARPAPRVVKGEAVEPTMTLVARELVGDMQENNISPLAQDLIAQCLNPRPYPCEGTFEEVHYVNKETGAKCTTLPPGGDPGMFSTTVARVQGCVNEVKSQYPDLAEDLEAGSGAVSLQAMYQLRTFEMARCAGGRCLRHCRISAERAELHPWILEDDPSSRSLIDQLNTLQLTTSRRKLHRAVSKIMFMRKIVRCLTMSVSGAATMNVQRTSSTAGGNDKVKDKGCACNCALQ